MTRTFDDCEAKRSAVPLMVGLVGPSGGGKTFSALRLATGIQRVTGGDIYFVDTEARRALHYAEYFKFRHVIFEAPFGPLDYLAAIEHCVKKGAKIVVVDSMSHEHEGPGGVLEMHAAETKRLAKQWGTSEDKAQMSAWGPAKADRRRMINSILQMPISSIYCFRAKEKMDLTGPKPKKKGFMAIAGEEFTFEMTVNCLLLPRADGVPAWSSDEVGEQLTMKLPRQFAELFGDGVQLSEDIGESMAKWAAGGAVSRFGQLIAEIGIASAGQLDAIVPKIEEAKTKRTINTAECNALRAAFATKKKSAAAAPSSERPTQDSAISASERKPGED